MTRELLIWGCGGFGREVHWLCEILGIEVVGFLDERPQMKGVVVDAVPVMGDITDLIHLRGKVPVLCAGVGDPALKRKFASKTLDAGFAFAEPIIHPDVRVSKRNHIGTGSVITEGTIMTVNVDIGRHVVVNLACTLGHDIVMEDYCTVSPGVNLSGNVRVGEGAYLGTGCAIREKVVIGPWSVVGGGAFVARDVRAHTLVAGVPADFKKDL